MIHCDADQDKVISEKESRRWVANNEYAHISGNHFLHFGGLRPGLPGTLSGCLSMTLVQLSHSLTLSLSWLILVGVLLGTETMLGILDVKQEYILDGTPVQHRTSPTFSYLGTPVHPNHRENQHRHGENMHRQ